MSFLSPSSAILLLLFPTFAFATTSGALGMGEVYSVEDPYPSEIPHFQGGDPHDVGPDGSFGGWLTPLFGTADEEKRDSESLERVFLQSGCWNTTEDGKEMEVECRCSGDDIVDVPGNLTKDVSRISIVRAGLVTLRRGALQPYAATLKDLVLMNVEQLESIEDHAFENLTELRTIYIDHAPKLRNISDQVFGEHLPRLRILRIVHTGLSKIPNFMDLRVESILHMIDLENNQIDRVYSNSVKVRSEQFLLNYNLITEVEDFAFNNSEIAKLSLKGNRRLCTIGQGGFVGLQSLRDLDLSETSITQMPTRGLQMLEILRLQDTETLKVIPSVYNFQLFTVIEMETNYEPLEVEQLIAEVKSRPVIWNSNLEEYNDRAKKYQAWQEVIKVCTAGWESMSPFIRQEKAKEIQKRWKNVRDHYVREIKMLSGGVVRKKRKYIYFDRLSFLGSVHQNKITSTTSRFKSSLSYGGVSEESRSAPEGTTQEEDSNGDCALYDRFADLPAAEKSDSGDGGEGKDSEVVDALPTEGGGRSPVSESANSTPPEEKTRIPKCQRRVVKGSGRTDFKMNLLEILKASVASREEQSGDEDRLFMLSLVPELKRVPPARRLLVKTQIIQAILQGQQFRDLCAPR